MEAEGTVFVQKSSTAPLAPRYATEMDEALDADALMRVAPEYYGPRFQAIADLRAMDDGSLHRGNEFRRVASFVNVPLFKAATTVLDPEFLKDKRRFYAWLRRNRRYCTYDIRSHAVGRTGMLTHVNGKAV